MKKVVVIAVLAIAVSGSCYYVIVRLRENRELLAVKAKQRNSDDARAQKAAVLPVTEAAGPVPIWWSPKLGLASLSDIPQRMEKQEPPPAQEISFSKGFPPAERVSISACSQYLAAKDNGFYPNTDFDAGMEGYFTGTCFALRYLEKVRPASRSYLDPNGWSDSALSMLPPILCDLGVEGSIATRVLAARSAGQSWAAFDPGLKLDRIDGYTLTAESSALGGAYSLEVLARGDFNGDGIEDWAVAGYTSSNTGGTFHESAFYILTRLGPDAVVSIVEEGSGVSVAAAQAPCSDCVPATAVAHPEYRANVTPEDQAALALVARARAVGGFAVRNMKISVNFTVTHESGLETGTFVNEALENVGSRKQLQERGYDEAIIVVGDKTAVVGSYLHPTERVRKVRPVVADMAHPRLAFPPDSYAAVRNEQVNGQSAECVSFDRNRQTFSGERRPIVALGEVCFDPERGVVLRSTTNGETWLYSDYIQFDGKLVAQKIVFDVPAQYHVEGTVSFANLSAADAGDFIPPPDAVLTPNTQ